MPKTSARQALKASRQAIKQIFGDLPKVTKQQVKANTIKLAVYDTLIQWRETNQRETIPGKAYFEIAEQVAKRLIVEL